MVEEDLMQNGGFFSNIKFIFCHILEIEFIEMGETAVLATDGKMPASYHNVMESGYMTVPAICCFFKVPDIITANPGKCPRLRDILDPRNKDPGRPAVVTCYFSLVGNCFNNLVCDLPAMIAVGPIPGKNKLVAHADTGCVWVH